MNKLRIAAVVLGSILCCAMLGCSGTKNVATNGDFVINFAGFTPEMGKQFYLKLVDTTVSHTAGLSTPMAIATDSFSISLPDVVTPNHSYNVDFWVDEDGNATLDKSPTGTPAGVDHSWRVTGTADEHGLALTFTHDVNYDDITPF
jgi:hypothetical protein